MSIAVDASTPVRWSAIDAGTNVTSASFTAPTDALLVLTVQWDTSNSTPRDATVVSDTGSLSWTQQVIRSGSESTAGGGSGIWTARTTSSVSRTVTVAYTTLDAGAGTKRISCKLYVLTGVDVNGTPVDTVTASNEGTGSTQTNQALTALTPGANGLQIVSATDWNVAGTITSSDLTIDGGQYAGAIDVAAGTRTVTSGVSVTSHLTAGGAGPQWKWCDIIVREAAGGGAAFIPPANKPIQQAVKRASYW